MTPSDFAKAIRTIIADDIGDEETQHIATDSLMEETLIELGYGEGVALLDEMTRWYS